MTFSIAARSTDARLFGVAIASSSPAVAARCAHARAGVGAVATQNITDPSLGSAVLDGLARGSAAREALAVSARSSAFAEYRQLLVVGARGAPEAHTGERALGLAASHAGAHAIAAGNLLAQRTIPSAMIAAFEASSGHFGDALLDALRAAVERGGEVGPIHSAGLLIVREVPWPIVDLRVDWMQSDPVAALACIWEVYAPQIEEYVQRALDPSRAPSFNVPGARTRDLP